MKIDTLFRFCSSSGNKLQYVDEDHDDVDVEHHCTQDVVINGKLVAALSQDQLGIKDEINAKQHSSYSTEEHMEEVAVEEDREEGQHKEGHAENPDEAPFHGEVDLGGPSVGCDSSHDAHSHGKGDSDRAIAIIVEVTVWLLVFKIRVGIIDKVHAHPGDEVRLAEGENEECDVVCWHSSRQVPVANQSALHANGHNHEHDL